MDEEFKYWIALSTVNDVGPGTIKKLLAVFGNPEEIFRASTKDLIQVSGIGSTRAQSIASFKNWSKVDKIIKCLENTGTKAISIYSSDYPSILKEIPAAPVLLYVRGKIQEDDRYALAVVGSRKATHYGVAVTETLVMELVEAGFTIVSGLARGIDSIAHKQALRSGGRTITVLGCGVDIAYPPENRGLMERIAERGAVLSEYPPGTKPHKEHFPVRNRLISGISLGVLVVEATKGSGSLITASMALNQNREVFAVPGNIMSPTSSGTHALIKEGAKLVQNVNDIVGELSHLLKGFIKQSSAKAVDLDDEEEFICKIIPVEPVHIDEITRKANIPPQRVMSILLSLELKGVVKQLDGMKFCLLC